MWLQTPLKKDKISALGGGYNYSVVILFIPRDGRLDRRVDWPRGRPGTRRQELSRSWWVGDIPVTALQAARPRLMAARKLISGNDLYFGDGIASDTILYPH